MYPFDNEEEEEDIDDNIEPQQPVAPVAPTFNPADIAAIVTQTMAAHQVPQQPRAMTAEEAAEHFQVYNPDDSFVNGLNRLSAEDSTPEERRAIVAALRDGFVNQSFRASELLVEQRMQAMEQRFAPALALAQQQEAQALQASFETKYPSLKGQTELVNSITAGLAQQGFKPKSKDEAFDKVAELAGQILTKVNPEFKLRQGGGNNSMPSMAGTNMGGQGGGFQAQPQGQQAPAKRGGLASFYQK